MLSADEAAVGNKSLSECSANLTPDEIYREPLARPVWCIAPMLRHCLGELSELLQHPQASHHSGWATSLRRQTSLANMFSFSINIAAWIVSRRPFMPIRTLSYLSVPCP